MVIQPLGPLQTEWISRLRSGKYEQGETYLRYHDRSSGKDQFCCLGVACELAIERGSLVERKDVAFRDYTLYGNGSSACLPRAVMELLKFRGEFGNRADGDPDLLLSALNDEGKTFEEIAEIVAKDPSQYFVEPA